MLSVHSDTISPYLGKPGEKMGGACFRMADVESFPITARKDFPYYGGKHFYAQIYGPTIYMLVNKPVANIDPWQNAGKTIMPPNPVRASHKTESIQW